jgi:hypothetical protein
MRHLTCCHPAMSTISSHDIGAPLPPNLSKLTVTQLKAICKERRIVGYSKLGKAALLRKLGELGPNSLPPSSAQTAQIPAQPSSLLLESDPSPAHVNDSLAPAAVQRPMGKPSRSPHEPNTVPGTHIPQSSARSESIPAFNPPSCLPVVRGQIVDQSVSAPNVPGSKRVSSKISQGAGPLAKKPKISSPLSARAAIPSPTSVHLLGGCGVPGSPFSAALPDSALVPQTVPGGKNLDGGTQTVSMSGQRFKPLKVTPPLSATLGDKQKSQCLPQGNKSATVTVQPSHLWHLDFSRSPEPPLLSAIAIPPPLSQRKLVQRWATILDGLSDEQRLRCCLVSKLIRYAGKPRLLD